MGIISYVLIGYLAGAIVTGARLGWHLAFRLDEIDWQYAKFQIWVTFATSTLLWPMMLLKPKNLIDPSELFSSTDLFDVDSLMAARMREESRMWSNAPLCGAQILFRQSHVETSGEFIFRCDEIEKVYGRPHLAKRGEVGILNWLRMRDDAITVPTAVPAAWEKEFESIADAMLRQGRGEIRCLKCDKLISVTDLLKMDDHGKRGWNYNRLLCPNNHQLLKVRKAHIYCG